jgi:hypothetical protein
MSAFGFTFQALYHLEVEELCDLGKLIEGKTHYLPPNKEVLIRGVIIPFLREASKAPKEATKDQVMRAALVRVAKDLGISCKDWETAETDWIMQQVKKQWIDAFHKQFESLNESDRQEILKKAEALLSGN